ncbi:degenerate transposase (orf2) [Streptococcus pneumoniae 2009]|nr:degenerate transposase (orf2) [Streptococcus pneumoniae 2009]
MSFIAQDFNNLNIITVLEGRTQAVIRNHFLRYDRAVRCQVKIITMDMFSLTMTWLNSFAFKFLGSG